MTAATMQMSGGTTPKDGAVFDGDLDEAGIPDAGRCQARFHMKPSAVFDSLFTASRRNVRGVTEG